MRDFPVDFLWGSATSSYQVEGNNDACDWWEWEQGASIPDRSGMACNHYSLFHEDFSLARSLGHNCHRLSLEWSRIEPKEGEFSEKEIGHYKEVIASLHSQGLEPVVTLHHFTSPLWFSRMGGWLNPKAHWYFRRFVEKVVPQLCGQVKFWVTINEPMIYVYESYVIGAWPPQQKSLAAGWRVTRSLLKSHIAAYRAIKKIYSCREIAHPMVSIAHNMRAFVPCNQKASTKAAVFLRDYFFNRMFLNGICRARAADYIGVNYYSRDLIDACGWGTSHLFFKVCGCGHDPLRKNSLGWDIYPEGLYRLLLSLKKYSLPVFILENGICTDDDGLRWNFIREHLQSVRRAMREGVPVIGYLYWSLLDNFEWDKGFAPRFGLVDVDYKSFQRQVRESARKFGQVCRTGELPADGI